MADRSHVLRHLIVAMLLLCLFAVSCAVPGGTTDTEAETRFEELFGSTLTDKLIIVTDKSRYHSHDAIIYWVENKTSQTIFFRDQSYEVQALAYQSTAKAWVEVDLGFRVGGPTPKAIEPGEGGVLEHYGLEVDSIRVAPDGKIRLVITGHTDLANPALDRVYLGYTDVEVVE